MNLFINQPGGRQSNFKSAYFVAIFIALMGCYIASLAYAGKQYNFWIFCISAYCMLGYGIFQKKSFGFLVLCIFLWLGYWLKSVSHLLLDYPFREPMGYFSFSPVEWDKFYLIASLGMFVAIISGIFFLKFRGQSFLDRSSFASLCINDKCNLRVL